MNAPRFLLSFAISLTILSALAASINGMVDPYLLFGMPRWVGFNAIKPAVESHEGLMKAYEAPRRQARTLIVGSSRTDLGLDPAHACWPENLRPVYNLSQVGAGLESNLRSIQHMVASNRQDVKTQVLLVGLDFESFLIRPKTGKQAAVEATSPDERAERLAVLPDGQANPARALRRLKDVATGLLSLDALSSSLETVLASRGSSQPNLEISGHLSEGRFRQWIEADGYATLFAQKNMQTVKNYLSPHRVLGEPGDEDGMSAVRRLLDYARQHGMRVVLAIQPAHASRLELLDAMGYWADYEQWKRALSQQVVLASSAGLDVSLWDFGGYEFYARETIPAQGDRRSSMKWYWDPVHYSAALGDLMVRRMLADDDTSGVGVRLSPEVLDSHLAKVRVDREAYRRANPDELSRIARAMPATWQ